MWDKQEGQSEIAQRLCILFEWIEGKFEEGKPSVGREIMFLHVFLQKEKLVMDM